MLRLRTPRLRKLAADATALRRECAQRRTLFVFTGNGTTRLVRRKGRVCMDRETFTYEARGQILIIHLPRELDHHNCRNLRYETDLLLAENYVNKVIFDFSRTEFMDSSGIGVLLNRYKQMAGSGGKVAMWGAGKQVKRILTMGGVFRLIKNFDTREAAMAD